MVLLKNLLGMKRKYINAILACSMAVSLAACTDVWDEHYQSDPALNGSESLWELISNDPELDDFEALLQATGYDEVLQQKRSYTVWAPANLSDLLDMSSLSTASDSLLAVYRKEIVENHIADYSQVAGGIRDKEDKKNYKRVVVLNGKSYHFEGSVSNAYSFAGQQLSSSNIVATNGVLHKVNKGVLFAANIWEQMAKEPSIGVLYRFLDSKTDTTFNENASVPGSIIDGKQHYLDSVFNISNRWVDNNPFSAEWGLGRLNNEDSSYTVYALTNSAWNDLYKQVRRFYNYPNVVVKEELRENAKIKLGSDSLRVVADSLVREMLCENLVFSNTVNKKFFQGERDTLISTRYKRFKDEDAHALHDGCEKELVLSNGTLHLINQVNFKPYTWGYDTIRIQGEDLRAGDDDVAGSGNSNKSLNAYVEYIDIEKDHALYDLLSRNRIAKFEPKSDVASAQPKMYFYPKNVLSGYYKISIVLLPPHLVDPEIKKSTKKNNFTAKMAYVGSDGTVLYQNLDEKVENASAKPPRYIMSDPNVVDTIVLAERFKFDYSEYNYKDLTGKEPQTCLIIETPTTNSVSGTRATHTNTYYVDQVMFEPVEDIE